MMTDSDLQRLKTGVKSLDEILDGGLPKGSAIIVSGPPGTGKTTLTQQICFHNASEKNRVLYFSTLSEPAAKSLRYLQQFEFFDPKKLGTAVHFVDLGVIARSEGLAEASALMMEHVKKVKPAIVVVDSFKVFDDLAKSNEERRKFSYEVAVNLMAWEATAFLIGEYARDDFERNPLFSVVDGLISLSERESSGENQRFLRVVKMRGAHHSRDEHAFLMRSSGIEIFPPRVSIRREDNAGGPTARCTTHNTNLDAIIGPGIPWGSSVLISGVAGTGKTVLSLEFLYRGALAGEKGIFFSFEETEERLRATARGLGWKLDREIERGMVEIVFIPQPDIMVEAHLMMIRERVETMGAKRVVLDSVSVFLHKVRDPQLNREKVFHLCSVIQNAQAVGFLATDIPYGSTQISRFGVEETVVDGVILLSSTEEGFERQRYIEIYKMRNTAHLKGRHNIVIGSDGVSIFPRYSAEPLPPAPEAALDVSRRIKSGIPGLDKILGGGLLDKSATLVSGSAGSGKSTLGMQFVLGAVDDGDRALYVTLEEAPAQLLASAKAMGLPLEAAVQEGWIELLYISRENIRAGQFLTVLAKKLESIGAKRVVLDAAMNMMTGLSADNFRHLLYNLLLRFKALGVTSMVTLEAPGLFATDAVTDLYLSPIADNLLMLRYVREGRDLLPSLTVVKSRGSKHDRKTFALSAGMGGMSIGDPLGDKVPAKRRAKSKSRKLR